MARYPQGQPIRLSTTVRDVTGTLVDAGTLTLLVKTAAVDGTWTTTGTYATPAHDGLGLYHVDIPATDLTSVGHYQYSWTSTGTGAGVSPPSEFDVYDPFETVVLSLQDAKGQLNMDPASHTFDDELQDFIAATIGAAEAYKHEVIVRRTVTDTLDLSSQGGYGYGWGYGLRRQKFWLRSAPVISLTSVVAWDSSVTWDVTQMRATPAGLVRVMAGMPVTGLANVTYLAGLQQVPPNYRRGMLVILQHLWETQRGPGTAASGVIGSEEHWRQPGEFFSVPDKAKELLGPPRPVMA
jgi:hypothetical protein